MVQKKPEPTERDEPRNPESAMLRETPTEEGLTSRNLEKGTEGERSSEESP